MRVCVCVCVRACVRACVCVCVCARGGEATTDITLSRYSKGCFLAQLLELDHMHIIRGVGGGGGKAKDSMHMVQ